MFLNPLINVHAGIYTKVDPSCKSNVEIFILRPDMLVAWDVKPVSDDNYFEDVLFHGRWHVGPESMNLWLTDEDEQDLVEMNFNLIAGEWFLESNPSIYLKKELGVEYIKGPFYYDY